MYLTTRPSRALLTLAIAAAIAPFARADDWVVRTVRLGTGSFGDTNVDVLPSDTGVSVGYTFPGDPNLYLSSLSDNQPYFQHQSSTQGYFAASFAADAGGNVFFAGGVPGGIRVGQDASAWGLGLVDGPHPTPSLGTNTRLPAMAVDPRGFPAFVAVDTAGQHVYSRFDVPSGTWQNQTLPNSHTTYIEFVHSALAYTPDGRAVVAYGNASTSQTQLVVDIQTGPSSWLNFDLFTLPDSPLGVSVAVAPDGRIGVAYPAYDGLRVATFDGSTWTSDSISIVPARLEPHSLTVDASGHFALAYAPSPSVAIAAPVHVSTRADNGTWADQTLPFSACQASLAFDSSNHPYVGAFDGSNVLLAGTAVPSLPANDFTLDGTVNADDVPAFAQAMRHPATYLASHAPLTTTDLVSIGDHNHDGRLTDADARAFADSLSSSPVPGLSNRTAGFLAFDQADLDPNAGSGAGNFFGTVLSTSRAYTPGASRADLTGPTPGVADSRIDASDINYLHAALLTPGGTTDPRLDINGDGVVNAADLRALVHDILGTTEGDANADGRINADDFALVDRGFASGVSNWTDGDFNLDGLVTAADYLLLDTAFAQSNGGTLSPSFLSMRQSEFGDAYVTSLLATLPEPSSLFAACGLAIPLLTRRRNRVA